MDVNSLSDDDLIALSQNNFDALSDDGLVFLASQKKRKTTFGEDVGIALNQASQPFVKASGLLAGGVAGLLGKEEAQENIYKGMQNISKSMNEYWTPKDAEQTFGGKLAGAATTLPVQMAGMLFSPAETGTTFIDNGESLDAAQKAALIDTAGNVAGLAYNPVGKILPTMAKAAGFNVAQDVATKAMISDIANQKETKEQFKPTLESAAISGIIGGGFGALGAGGDAKLNVKVGKTDYDTPLPKDKTPSYGLIKNIEDAKITLETERASIEEQLSRQSDMDSEYSQKLISDLKQKEQAILNLDIALGNKVDRPAPEVKSDLETEYRQAESALVDVEAEYKTLAKRGAALTSEEKVRLQQLQEEHATLSDYLEQNAAKVLGEDIGAEAVQNKTLTEVPQNIKQSFEPLSDMVSVNDAVMSKDYSGVSKRNLEKAIEIKQQKIDEVRESILQHGIGSPQGQRALSFYDILRKELEHIENAYNKKVKTEQTSQDSFIQLNREMLSSEHAVPLRQVLETDGLRGGLAYLTKVAEGVNASVVSKLQGKLAKALLDNPLVNAVVRFNETMDPLGRYNNIEGDITIRGNPDPEVVLHEATHSAINKTMSLHLEGKLTNPTQTMAANGIIALRDRIKNTPDFWEKVVKTFGEDHAKTMFDDVREFVSYSLTNYQLQLTLQRMKLGGTPIWSKLSKAFKDLLGLKGDERTALDDVLRYGESLIQSSDGLPLGRKTEDGLFSNMRAIHTPQNAWSAIKNGSLRIFAHGFTQNLRQMMRHNPEFSKLAEFVDEADRARESLVRLTTYGKDSFQDWANKGRFFFKLGGAENKDALVPAMHGMKGVDIATTMDSLMDGYRRGVDIQETINNNKANWTPEQTNLANAVAKAVDKLWEAAVKMQGGNNLNPKLKQRMGYVLTSRTGDYATTINVNGVTIRSEYFMTKAEADHWANWFRQQTAGNKYVEIKTDSVENLKSGSATDNLVDFIDSLKGLTDDEINQKLQNTYTALTEENSAIGSHSRQSGIISGFTGDHAGMTPHQRGERWRSALPRAVNEYAQSIMSRDVQKKLIEWHIDNDHKTDGITKELGDFYVKSQLGRPYDEGTLRDMSRKWSNKFREIIDTGVDKVFGFSHRDKHAFDRFMGLFSNAFYTANITMKPAIWIAQPLQALQSVRSAFKEGESPRQVLAAFGETLTQLAGGKMMANKDFAEALYHVSQDGNILHPQMTNEFNDWHIGTDPNSTINKVVNLGTGRNISAAGDKFSRYASFTFFYNLHKRSGLTGKELWNTAGRDATENMVAYGNKKLPAIYREMGIVGEQGAPLATFIHTQAGNMIVDIKEFIKQPGARTSAPLILTAAVSMILGGAISMPVIAEYELLRQAGKASGWWGNEWPSVSDLILKEAPVWVSHGVASAIEPSIDVDASMRYTSMLNKIAEIERQGLLAFAPHLSWASDVIGNAPTAILGTLGGDVTNAEMDQALKKTLPKGIVAGAVDTIRHGDDAFTHTGRKGVGGVQRDLGAQLAPWFGTRSTREAMDTQAVITKQQRDKEEKELLSRAAQHYGEGRVEYGNKAMTRLLTKYYNGDRNKLQKALETQQKAENTPLILREYFGVEGNQTEDQARQFVRDNMAPYMKKRFGDK